MLISDEGLRILEIFKYYFKGTTGKYCKFYSERELKIGSPVIIDDVLDLHILEVESIQVINGKKLVAFKNFEVIVCRRDDEKLDSL